MSVTSDDPAAVTEGLVWAKRTHEQLVRFDRTQTQAANDERESASQLVEKARDGEQSRQQEETPVCQVHDLPMVKVMGKRGEFWSCHQKNADGSWCSYRPNSR